MRLTSAEFIGNPRFPLSIVRRQPQPDYPLHQHEFTELVVVLAGSGWHTGATGRHPVAGGDVFLVSPGQDHGYEDVCGLALVNVMYDERSLGVPLWSLRTTAGYQALFRAQSSGRRQTAAAAGASAISAVSGAGGLRLDAAGLRRVEGLIGGIEAELTGRAPGYELLALAHLMELLGILAREYGQAPDRRNDPLLRLGEAVAYLEQRYNQSLTLAELASVAHMSANTLLRAFRKATGFSPLAYQMQLRIQQARQMLLRTGASIGEIAAATGFADSNYFTRQFRKLTGMSPTACRQQTRQE